MGGISDGAACDWVVLAVSVAPSRSFSAPTASAVGCSPAVIEWRQGVGKVEYIQDADCPAGERPGVAPVDHGSFIHSARSYGRTGWIDSMVDCLGNGQKNCFRAGIWRVVLRI